MTSQAPVLPRSRTLAERLLRVPWLLLLTAALIAGCGAVALYSVAGGSMSPWSERHIQRFLLAAGIALVIAMVPIRAVLVAAYPSYLASLLLLALVPLIGNDALGARRWLGMGGFSIQPSELMKVALVLALARYYHWLDPARRSLPQWVAVPLALIALPAILTLRQPDLGTAVLLAGVGLGVMFLAGVSIVYFVAAGGGAALALPYAIGQLHDYQRRRIEVFLDPDQDPLGAGYHITQSKIAVGSGGASGKGLLQGTQSQLDFVPEKQTDFIFSMIAEEWGWSGGLLMLGLYAALLLILLSMAVACRHQLGRLLVAGVSLMVSIYVVINVGMVAGLVPVVGVPLPLVSYGGSAMFGTMVALGLAMSAFVERDELLRREDCGMLW